MLDPLLASEWIQLVVPLLASDYPARVTLQQNFTHLSFNASIKLLWGPSRVNLGLNKLIPDGAIEWVKGIWQFY